MWKTFACRHRCARANTTTTEALTFPSIPLMALLFLGVAGSAARADQVTDMYGTGTPSMSWAYSNLLHVGKSGAYYPLRADYDNAVFQGFVSTPGNGSWGGIYDSADVDGIFVFRTYVLSSVNQMIPLTFGGDDNASVYVNGVFQDYSIIFTRPGHFDLSLTAGVPVLLEIAIYNGPDGWVLGLRRSNEQNLLGNGSTITIDAVPEPTDIFLVAVGLVLFAAGAYRRRGLTSR